VVLLILARIFGLRGGDKWLFSLGLAQAGEFGFVLLSLTVASSVIPAGLADQLLLIVALSMLLTPALFILYDRSIAPRYTVEQDREADEMPEGRKILIAGAGRVGGLIDRILKAAGHECTVIDYNSRRLDILARFGTRHYFGDATRPDLLHAAGIEEAAVFVIAIDDREKTTELVHYVAENFPKVHMIARATDRDHVYDLWAAGCRDIVRETYDSTLRMGRSAFEALGLEREVAEEVIEAFNSSDRRAMLTAADAHKPGVAPHENEDYIKMVREMRGDWERELSAEISAIIARGRG
jgi:CPA2 family monovalent cation:H+ antiporter-2